ncbi:MAG: S1 family peptidase, partial [Pseudobdellovibrionaceae bacterium]
MRIFATLLSLSILCAFLGHAMAQTKINGLQIDQLPASLKPQPLPTMTGNQIFAKAKRSVFRLSTRMKGTQSENSHGTAFVVNPNGLLITNFHVVLPSLESSEKNELILESPGGNLPAVVLMIDSINDLALVQVNYHFITTLPVAETFNLMPGDTIFSLGFPIREELSLIQGLFNGQQSQGVAPFFRASTPLNGGMSGGPTLNSAGEVVAVNRAVLTKAQNISYLSPWAPLKKIVSAGVLMSEQHLGTHVSVTNWKTFVSNQILEQEKILFSTNGQSQHNMQKIGELRFHMPFANMECGQDQILGKVNGKYEFINCENINLSIM